MAGFPTDPSKLRVGVAFGADISADPNSLTYTYLTSDVMPQVVITRGRVGFGAVTQPMSTVLTFKDPLGYYSPRNITGPHYGSIRKNTPMVVQIDPGTGTYVTRGSGLVPEWSPTWLGPNMGDQIQINAVGMLARIAQDQTVRSAMRRTIVASDPQEYWPLEDASNSTQASSALSDSPPLTMTGVIGFGQAQGPDGGDAAVDLTGGGTLYGTIDATGTTSDRVEIAIKPVALSGTTEMVMRVFNNAGGGIDHWDLNVANLAGGGLQLSWVTSAGAVTTYTSSVAVDDGNWHHVRVDVAKSGSNTNIQVTLDDVVVINQTPAVTFVELSDFLINPVAVADTLMPAVGHIVFWKPFSSSLDTYQAFTGYGGETAASRFDRITSDEENIFSSVNFSFASQVMGIQTPMTTIDILRQCETSDEGTLVDEIDNVLGFDQVAAHYNLSATMTLNYSQLADLGVNDSNTNAWNEVSVSRIGGAAAFASLDTGPLSTDPATGVGTLVNPVSRSLDTDLQAVEHAHWLLNVGTVDEPRYVLTLNFRAAGAGGLITQWLTANVGKRVVVNSPPSLHLAPEPLDLIIAGYVEMIDAVTWTAVLYCEPYRPYEVLQIATGSGNRSRIPATDGSTTTNVQRSATDTSIAITSTTQRWIDSATYASKFPFDITIAGEVMSCTAITGTTLSQTMTVTRGKHGVSKILPAGSTVQLWRAPVLAL